jgi:predicted 3-demethylubiquinone-9 3-methyltransferase (glyoxalase superfamily)
MMRGSLNGKDAIMPKITPCLWFDGKAEEAAKFYVSIFRNSKINSTSYYTDSGPGVPGSVLTVDFELDGQPYQVLNGGPDFKFNEAISLSIDCKTQEDVDSYTAKLIAGGGEQGPCGWVKDKYGVSWQVVPSIMGEMITDSNRKKVDAVMQAMMKMKKLDIETLKKAYLAA